MKKEDIKLILIGVGGLILGGVISYFVNMETNRRLLKEIGNFFIKNCVEMRQNNNNQNTNSPLL